MKRTYLILLLMLPFVATLSVAEEKGGIPQYIPEKVGIPTEIGTPLSYCISYVLEIPKLQAELDSLRKENEQLRAEIDSPEPETRRTNRRRSSIPTEPDPNTEIKSDGRVEPETDGGSNGTVPDGGKKTAGQCDKLMRDLKVNTQSTESGSTKGASGKGGKLNNQKED